MLEVGGKEWADQVSKDERGASYRLQALSELKRLHFQASNTRPRGYT